MHPVCFTTALWSSMWGMQKDAMCHDHGSLSAERHAEQH